MRRNKFISIIGIVFMLCIMLIPFNTVMAEGDTFSTPAHYYVLKPNHTRPTGNEHDSNDNYVKIGDGTVSDSVYAVNDVSKTSALLGTVPDNIDIDFGNGIISADSYYLVWYRTIKENNGWHVDGYIIDKTPESITVNFFVNNVIVKQIYTPKGNILTAEDIPDELDYVDENGSWKFDGWYLDMNCIDYKADMNAPVNENTNFYGVYRKVVFPTDTPNPTPTPSPTPVPTPTPIASPIIIPPDTPTPTPTVTPTTAPVPTPSSTPSFDNSKKYYVAVNTMEYRKWVAPDTADKSTEIKTVDIAYFMIMVLLGVLVGRYVADERKNNKK